VIRFQKLQGLLLYVLCMVTVEAGTPGLSGNYTGDYQFEGWAYPGGANRPPTLMGIAVERQNWDWDFDKIGVMSIDTDSDGSDDITVNYTGMIYFERGDLYPASNEIPYDHYGHWTDMGYHFPYLIENWQIGAPVVDNGDGSYTAWFDLQIWNWVQGLPRAWIDVTWRIEHDETTGELTMVTLDSDNNGYPGKVNYTSFPFPFEPRFDGVARQVGIDSNADGLVDTMAIALDLDPDSRDTDGDGIDDVIELGAPFADPLDIDADGVLDAIDDMFNNPPDSDADSLIDALEPAGYASDASIMSGLRFNGRDASFDEATLLLGVSIPGQTLQHMPEASDAPSSGQDRQGPPAIKFAFNQNNRATSHGPVFSFTSSLSVGGMVDVSLVFSSYLAASAETASLPDKILLYRVESEQNDPDNIGANFHLMPQSLWSKIDNYTLVLHLQDGGSMDDDGEVNGSITTTFALADNYMGDIQVDSGNGMITAWWLLVMSGLILLIRNTNERKQN